MRDLCAITVGNHNRTDTLADRAACGIHGKNQKVSFMMEISGMAKLNGSGNLFGFVAKAHIP